MRFWWHTIPWEQEIIHSPDALIVLDSYHQKAHRNCFHQNRWISAYGFASSVDKASARITKDSWNVSLLSQVLLNFAFNCRMHSTAKSIATLCYFILNLALPYNPLPKSNWPNKIMDLPFKIQLGYQLVENILKSWVISDKGSICHKGSICF